MPIVLSGLMTIAFVFGRFSNSSPLTGNDAYRVHLTVETYLSALAFYFGKLAYLPGSLNASSTALLLVLLLVISLVARERSMLFALFFLMVAPLPVALVALRGGYVMYIPVFGIALYLASLLAKIRQVSLTRLRRTDEEPGVIATATTFLLCTVALLRFHSSHPLPVLTSEDFWVKTAVEQVVKTPLNLHQGSRILFLDDPLRKDEGIVLVYIFRLYYQIHDLTVDRIKSIPDKPNQATIDTYDLLLHYDATGIVAVKR
jgi:hypothetical protein